MLEFSTFLAVLHVQLNSDNKLCYEVLLTKCIKSAEKGQLQYAVLQGFAILTRGVLAGYLFHNRPITDYI